MTPDRELPPEPIGLGQLLQQLLRLSSRIESIQTQVNQMAAAVQQDQELLVALVRRLSESAQQEVPWQDRLVEFTEQLEANHARMIELGHQLTQLATQEQVVRLAMVVATQQQVTDLSNQLHDLIRAQQRENELTESRGRQMRDLLETIQAVLSRRRQVEESQVILDQEQLATVRQEARGEFVSAFLPALDGLERVLEEGRVILARHRQEIVDAAQTPPPTGERGPSGGLVNRLRSRLAGEGESGEAGGPPTGTDPTTAKALYAWLRSLALVRDRFLALMAQEGIQPIPTLRRAFDPMLHLAVQTEARTDVPPDTIVREVRRGFRQGMRILRYAEVVVARRPTSDGD